jgi:hypothetical protein
VPVKDVLQAAGNKMTITIHPAIPFVINAKKTHPYYIPTVTVSGCALRGRAAAAAAVL